MNKQRFEEVKAALLKNTVGYDPAPSIKPWPNDDEFSSVGLEIYKETKSPIVTLEDGTKCKKIGKSRTWAGAEQYDTYICEDGGLVGF